MAASSSASAAQSYWTPLHQAVQDGQVDEVACLLPTVDINAQDSQGRTPLFVAVEYDHLNIVQLLVSRGADLRIPNQKGTTPLHLALSSAREMGRTLITWRKTGPSRSTSGEVHEKPFPSEPIPSRAASSSSSADPRVVIEKELKESYNQGDVVGLLLSLEKLAELAEPRKAAHLLNQAYALARRSPSSIHPHYLGLVVSRLEEIERGFVPKSKSYCSHIEAHRERLRQLRAPTVSQEELVEGYEALLLDLIQEAAEALSFDLSEVAPFVLGSLARREIAPFSDVEFGFLYRSLTHDKRAKLVQLAELLSIKIINLGESEYKIIPAHSREGVSIPARSFTPSGFCEDAARLTPLGAKGLYSLMGTPSDLAKLYERGLLIVSNALRTMRQIGDNGDTLVEDCQALIRATGAPPGASSAASSSSAAPSRLSDSVARDLIEGHLKEYCPRLNQEKVSLRAFGIKSELMRPIQILVSALSAHYDITQLGTCERIDALGKRGLLSQENCEYLKRAFRRACALRKRAHLFYGTEKDILYFPRGLNDDAAARLFLINAKMSKQITEIYRTIIPFHKAMGGFLENPGEALISCKLYDKSIGTYEDRLRREFAFDAALESALTTAALRPTALSSQVNLARVQLDLGQMREALANLKAAISSYLEVGGKPSPHLAALYMGCGTACFGLHRYQEATVYYRRSLEMYGAVCGKRDHPEIVGTYSNLGSAFSALQMHRQAIPCHTVALRMATRIYGQEANIATAGALNNLGGAYFNMGRYDLATRYYNDALCTARALYETESHFVVAQILQNLAGVYSAIGDHRRALQSSESALSSFLSVYKERDHEGVASALRSRGTTLIAADHEVLLGRSLLEQSVAMYQRLFGDDSEDLNFATARMELGRALAVAEEHGPAAVMIEEALAIQRRVFNDRPSVDIVTSLMALGRTRGVAGAPQAAIALFDEAIAMQRELYQTDSHPVIADAWMAKGIAYVALEELEEACRCYQRSRDLFAEIMGIDHAHTQMVQQELDETEALLPQAT